MQAATKTPSSELRSIVDRHLRESDDPKLRREWERRTLEDRRPSGDYSELRTSLSRGSISAAWKDYQDLLPLKGNAKQSARSMILDAMKPRASTVTGLSQEAENALLRKMTPYERSVYNKAREHRSTIWKGFQEMLRTHRN
jgi:hypothetical protein